MNMYLCVYVHLYIVMAPFSELACRYAAESSLSPAAARVGQLSVGQSLSCVSGRVGESAEDQTFCACPLCEVEVNRRGELASRSKPLAWRI